MKPLAIQLGLPKTLSVTKYLIYSNYYIRLAKFTV